MNHSVILLHWRLQRLPIWLHHPFPPLIYHIHTIPSYPTLPLFCRYTTPPSITPSTPLNTHSATPSSHASTIHPPHHHHMLRHSAFHDRITASTNPHSTSHFGKHQRCNLAGSLVFWFRMATSTVLRDAYSWDYTRRSRSMCRHDLYTILFQ